MRNPILALWLFCCCLLANASEMHAQTNHKWETTIVCEKCTPVGFGYGDSTHSVIPVKFGYKNSNSVMYTKDAGRNWARSDTFYYYFNMPGDFDFLTFFPPSTYYMFNSIVPYYSSDEGKSWKERSPLNNTIGARMFTEQIGYRVFKEGTSCHLRATYDSGYFWFDRISDWEGSLSQLLMLDSVNMWRVGYKTLARTSDAGVTWTEVNPYLDRQPLFDYIIPTQDPSSFYVIGGPRWDSVFVLVTTDNGLSWEPRMEFAMNRVVRICEPSKDNLWLLVARKDMDARQILYDVNASRGRFADSLFFSTDAGVTWRTDMTFAGDSIIDLQFHDGVGYVVSFRDSMVKFSRYVPGLASVSSATSYDRTLDLYPHPANSSLTFSSPFAGESRVRLLDVLGRPVLEDERLLEEEQSTTLEFPPQIPNGLYFLEIARGDARAGQRFILQR